MMCDLTELHFQHDNVCHAWQSHCLLDSKMHKAMLVLNWAALGHSERCHMLQVAFGTYLKLFDAHQPGSRMVTWSWQGLF